MLATLLALVLAATPAATTWCLAFCLAPPSSASGEAGGHCALHAAEAGIYSWQAAPPGTCATPHAAVQVVRGTKAHDRLAVAAPAVALPHVWAGTAAAAITSFLSAPAVPVRPPLAERSLQLRC